ncbi:hypothetical protein WJX74_002839 [Apatococcus lobatus]|uniref:phytol kinase n=1 Tax=Apatococcus lobatus TaxID=904363 RepID=A0AAW1RAS0_9CHLO
MPGVQIQRCQSGQVAIDSFGAIDLQHESLRLSNAGRHEEAKAKAQSSLETRLKIKGPKSLDVGVALQRLAEVEGDLGNHQEALELAKRAMMVREGLRGEQLDAAVSRDEAARNLEALGRMHEAGEFRKAGPRGADGVICGGSTCASFASPGASLKTCVRCRAIWYCSPACQRTDWPRHKKFCKK